MEPYIIFLCHTGIFEDCKGDGNLIVIMQLILFTWMKVSENTAEQELQQLKC